MMTHFKLFFITLALFLVIDLFWLTVVMGPFYTQQLEHLARLKDGALKPDILSGLLVYVIMAIGLLFFVINPNASKPLLEIAGSAALFGFVVYGVYELTNYAVLEGWKVPIIFVDITWGMGVNSIVAVLVIMIKRYFKIV